MLLTTRDNNLFDTFFNDAWCMNPWFGFDDSKKAERMMNTDVQESEDAYTLEMDLPGYKKEDISAKLENGYLTITAEKNVQNEEQDENKKYIRRERYTGTRQRSFYVGEEIEQTDIKAGFKQGILTIEIPKKKEVPQVEEQKYITIEG